MLKPEIMSPAGYWPQLHAAIDAGADAVYFGLRHFTARAKVGFTLAELPEAMRTLHRRGVKGYVTFNTLVFDSELEQAAEALAEIARAGADAIIVQDFGITKLARRIAPQLEIHGSTQMSITDAEGIRLAQEMGVSRVVLARELSLDEVRAIRDATDCQLEIFVHGALCVSYSGQCLSSEAWGGRSANRGQCAQACRLPYEMLVDGRRKPLGDARYLLSPGDLYTLELMPEILKLGVSALKIEGRYKDAGYVALTTHAYRRAVDGATEDVRSELEQVYSRGLGPYFLSGTNHQAVVRGRTPRHRGLFMGTVTGVGHESVTVQAEAPIKAGDGVVFDAAGWRSPEESEEGGRIYEVRPAGGGQVELFFANKAIQFVRIRDGDLLWRTHDPELDKTIRRLPVHRQPVRVRVRARAGEPLATEWKLQQFCVTVVSEAPLEEASKQPISTQLLKDQFGRLGNTAYKLEDVELDVEGGPFAPAALLNQMRRDAVQRLEQLQQAGLSIEAGDPQAAVQALLPQPRSASRQSSQLHLLVRTAAQLDAAVALRPASITLDYLDLFGLRPSVERVQAAGIAARVASPRVLKPGEGRIVEFLLSLDCPILVRPAGLLHALRGKSHPQLTGDFSLNAANAITAAMLLDMDLDRLTPSHDLNAAQVAQLARQAGADRLEVVAYHHLPVFHTEHCVFCRFLSTGTSYLDCGRPCEQHRVALRDEQGRAHPVMADVGCRNTVFGAEAQQAGRHLDAWREAGIVHYRLEFVHESPDDVTRITEVFQETVAGRRTPEWLTGQLRRLSREGITEGSLFVPKEQLTLPVLQSIDI